MDLRNTHEDADHAATQDRTMSIKAQIHQLIDPARTETLVEIVGNPKNMPVVRG